MSLFGTALRVGAAYFTGGASEAINAGVQALDSHEADDAGYARDVRNEQLQREFAQNGIRWKVEDAKAAGLHPLAALGAQTMGYSPSGFGDSGSYMASQGQDISRMIHAASTADERNAARIAASLNLEHMELQNDYLRSQIARMNSNPNPPLPDVVDPSVSNRVNVNPVKMQATNPGADHSQAGTIADIAYAKTSTGLAIVPSKDVKEQIEDITVPQLMWGYRNNMLPNINPDAVRPDSRVYRLPKGYDYWKWNPLKQEFQPGKSRENPSSKNFKDPVDYYPAWGY